MGVRLRGVPHARLSTAHDNGLIITIRCYLCPRMNHYLPGDLQQLLGDVTVESLGRRRCEQCGKTDYISVRMWHPMPEERLGLVVRRLERVVTVRRPVWRVTVLD